MFSFFENLVKPFPAETPSEPPKGVVAFCRHYTKGAEKYLILMALLTGTLAVGEAYLFSILGHIVDWLTESDRSTFLETQWPKLITMAVFVLLGLPTIVTLHALVVHQGLMGNYPMSIRWRAHRYLLGQSYHFFQNEFSGRIATKVLQTALSVRETVMKLLDVLLFATVYLGTAIVLLSGADLRLGAPLFTWLLCYIGILRFFIPKLRAISAKQANARSEMTGRIVDSYTNILTVKLFSHTKRESSYVKDGMNEFLKTVYPQMRLATWLNIAVWINNMSLITVVSGIGIYLWLDDAISTGAIAIAISLAIRLTGMSHWIMWEVSALFENMGTVEDGMNTLAQPRKVQNKSDAEPLEVNSAAITFDNVTFRYPSTTHKLAPVFKELNLSIKSGERIGIVGRSGSGKSTLVNLLLRFYDIDSGTIKIDEQIIGNVDQESLRSHIGMVTQDTSLLHRSVKDNIAFGRPEATEDEVIQAAKQAHAHDFILGLEDSQGRTGYDAHVGERGVTLSGGQRQRIAIARVLLKNAPILILDEATSALDSEVEQSIQASLDELMKQKTVIAIAHRLSTIAAMDRLLVLDNGEIVEQGSHQELLALGGIYAQLWAHQSGGFIGVD